MNDNHIGLKIKELRSKKSLEIGRKYTGAMLAKDLDISRSYLGDIESGRTSPNEVLLGKIADVFDTDIWEIAGTDYNCDIELSEDVIKEEKARYNEVSEFVDTKIFVDKWIEKNDLNEIWSKIFSNHKSFYKFKNTISKYVKTNYESNDFDEYYKERNKLENIIKTRLYKKINNLINDELISFELYSSIKINSAEKGINQYSACNQDEVPIAAHNDDSENIEQQLLMEEDIRDL